MGYTSPVHSDYQEAAPVLGVGERLLFTRALRSTWCIIRYHKVAERASRETHCVSSGFEGESIPPIIHAIHRQSTFGSEGVRMNEGER